MVQSNALNLEKTTATNSVAEKIVETVGDPSSPNPFEGCTTGSSGNEAESESPAESNMTSLDGVGMAEGDQKSEQWSPCVTTPETVTSSPVLDLRNREIGVGKADLKKPRPARSVASAQEAFRDCSPLQLRLWRMCGAGMTLVTGLCYYLSPMITMILPALALGWRSKGILVFTALWYFLAFGIPSRKNDRIAYSRLFKSVALFFDADIRFEPPFEEVHDHPKPLVFLFFPHGTISFGGWCFGALRQVRPNLTAGATVLQYLPGVKFLIGPFGMVDSGRKALQKALKQGDVVLYSGGVAELFLSNPDDEKVYFDHRLGCIKLAMETGSDIVVTYLFGNTQMYRLAFPTVTARISRVLRASITIFLGMMGLPMSNRTKAKVVVSEIIRIPDYSKEPDKITTELLKEYHAIVKSELIRIFDTYKTDLPAYANKELIFV